LPALWSHLHIGDSFHITRNHSSGPLSLGETTEAEGWVLGASTVHQGIYPMKLRLIDAQGG
jgi:hypothetical protein